MRRNAAGQQVYAILRTTSATVTPVVSGATMTVVKDGTMAAGAGTLTYIGTGTPIGSTAGAVTGVWKYTATAGETNASAVSFIFGSATANTVVVEKFFEPTAGPILYQALLSATGGAVTNQTTIVLPSATPVPSADDDAYNGSLIVFYDGATGGQVAVGVISDYVGSTRTITLREAPGFTITTSDFLTIIADPGVKPSVPNRNVVVDAAGLVDATTVKIGPTGSGTAQTARDVGASVLLSSGTGTGQLILTSGKVDLSATGLDAIPVANPSGVADTFPKMVVQTWRRFFKKATKTATEIKTYADNGTTVVTQQTISDDGATQTQGVSS